MKKYLVIIAILGLALLVRPVESMSVQENIKDNGQTYSWEQWCWYTYHGGYLRKIKVATFSVESTGQHEQLQTDLCSK